jgi:hypothetical protein
VTKCTLKGNIFNNSSSDWDFVVNDEGFGFKQNNREYIYKPVGITPNCVKTIFGGVENFWVREFDSNVRIC